jgi:hypothetical protein
VSCKGRQAHDRVTGDIRCHRDQRHEGRTGFGVSRCKSRMASGTNDGPHRLSAFLSHAALPPEDPDLMRAQTWVCTPALIISGQRPHFGHRAPLQDTCN